MDVGLVILDGWGLNPDPQRDAVAAAETPTMDRYRERGAYGTLETHGRRVGLPEGQMGNSEVGHLTIGAGRVVTQESARVTDAIRAWQSGARPKRAPRNGERQGRECDGARPERGARNGEGQSREREDGEGSNAADPPLDENPAIREALEYADREGGRVHLLGLISDGGVHSYQSHVHAMADLVSEAGLEPVVHAFTDGRDTAPKSGAGFLADLRAHLDAVGGRVATVTGRYYAMDRDENWDRTARAYRAIVDREAEHTAPDAVAAVEASYDRGDTDEFVEPTLVEGGPALADGDAAVFCNFRADRARQLTRMLADIEPEWEPATDPPAARLVTLTEYDRTFDLPVAFPPETPEDTLGEVLAEAGRTQLRLAETEKYAHVTYFLNGGREVEFPGEIRRIVESPDVPTYDQQPEMSAPEVTDAAVEAIEHEDPDVAVVNYANADMVGHTGDFEAAVAAVEAVDTQLARLVDAMRAAGAHVLVTADHGNADEMGTREAPHTAHTTNPVPLVYLAPGSESGTDPERASGEPASGESGGRRVREGGTLADVAPTVLELAGLAKPPAMTGESLLE